MGVFLGYVKKERQCMDKINNEARSCNHCCRGKAVIITYSESYLACSARAPYCHLWPVRLYDIFPHYLMNGTIFGKTLLKIKCVLGFCLQQ